MRRLFLGIAIPALWVLMGFSPRVLCATSAPNEQEYSTIQAMVESGTERKSIQISYQPVEMDEYVEADNHFLSNDDIELIALVTMAEAEGECEEGKRLVIDTVLNRVDSKYFPDTVYDVIYQPHQFSSMWNGRADRCKVRNDICQLVAEEADSRLNKEVMFFTAGKYGKYGVPMFQIGNHYFSSYD